MLVNIRRGNIISFRPDNSFVYVLIDPLNYCPKYVGTTECLISRFKSHVSIKTKPKNKKQEWILSLREKGLRPIIITLKECSYYERLAYEKHFYNFFSRTYDLLQKEPNIKIGDIYQPGYFDYLRETKESVAYFANKFKEQKKLLKNNH